MEDHFATYGFDLLIDTDAARETRGILRHAARLYEASEAGWDDENFVYGERISLRGEGFSAIYASGGRVEGLADADERLDALYENITRNLGVFGVRIAQFDSLERGDRLITNAQNEQIGVLGGMAIARVDSAERGRVRRWGIGPFPKVDITS